jgi:hypothetical protein
MRAFAMLPMAVGMTACGSSGSGDTYGYGESEMETLIVGSFAGEWRPVSGTTANLSLEIARPAGTTSTPACGNRTFSLQSNSAAPAQQPKCVASSEMSLTASLTVDDGSFSALPLTGAFTVMGTSLSDAFLGLSDNTTLILSAEWYSGAWQTCRARSPGGTAIAECTLSRLAR